MNKILIIAAMIIIGIGFYFGSLYLIELGEKKERAKWTSKFDEVEFQTKPQKYDFIIMETPKKVNLDSLYLVYKAYWSDYFKNLYKDSVQTLIIEGEPVKDYLDYGGTYVASYDTSGENFDLSVSYHSDFILSPNSMFNTRLNIRNNVVETIKEIERFPSVTLWIKQGSIVAEDLYPYLSAEVDIALWRSRYFSLNLSPEYVYKFNKGDEYKVNTKFGIRF